MTVILPDTSRWSSGLGEDSGKDKNKTSGEYFNPWGWAGKLSTRYRSSLGYSSSTLYNSTRSSYQSYSFSYTNPEDREQVRKLLTSAYKSVREVIVILDFPFPVEVCFSSRSFFNKKGGNARCIFLSTNCLDKKETDSDKIDVICGSGIHEAAHLRYSELRVINSFIESIKRMDSKYGSSTMTSITTIIVNLLEDERVEDKLLKERPGFVEYLSKKKDWEFKNSPISEKKSFNDNTEVFFMIVRFLRYKDKIIEGDIPERYQKLFLEIGNMVAPIYNDPSLGIKGVCNISKGVSSLIISYLSLTPSDINKISRVTYYQEICSGMDMENPKIGISDLSTQETHLVDNFWLRTIEDIAKGSVELVNKNCIFHKAIIDKDDLSSYEEIKKKVSKYIPSIRRQLVSQSKNYEYIIHGCRTGLLDTTKLVEAYQGVPHVYKRLGHVVTSNLSVCILLDESGSMAYGKIETARETAILLNEALSSVPGVNLFIYGHSADYLIQLPEKTRVTCEGMVDITTYKEPGMSKDSFAGLNSISAKYENRDGDAILQVAKRVRKYTNDYCLMFVISDGEPLARGYTGHPAREHTRKQIVTVETTLNMTVIGICIDTIHDVEDIYPRYISLEHDLSNFAKNLGKIIKTEVLKTRVTTIT